MRKILGFLAFLGSSGTLFCCVIPALLATLAGGAAVSAFISAFPWLMPLSQHKEWLFGIAGLLLAVNSFFIFRSRPKTACPLPGSGVCAKAGRFSKVLFGISVVFYVAGFFTAFLLTPLLRFLER